MEEENGWITDVLESDCPPTPPGELSRDDMRDNYEQFMKFISDSATYEHDYETAPRGINRLVYRDDLVPNLSQV